MKIYHLFITILLFLTTFGQSQSLYHPSRILLKFAEASAVQRAELDQNIFNISELDAINKTNNLSTIKAIRAQNPTSTFLLEFENEMDILSLIADYERTGLFEYVEPDFIGYGGGGLVPDDPEYYKQWGLENDGSFSLSTAVAGADIDMQRAWEISTGSEEVVIAILDSGAKLDHPEFQGRIWKDDRGNRGNDFANDDHIPSDDHGHGTNVMGILAANSNNSGFAGINWNSQLMVLKILNSENFGYYSWWTDAIYFAADNGAKVINMSVGGSTYSSAMEDAINYATDKGVIIVACMMNENNNELFYPAAYANTIAVGATNPDDSRVNRFPWGFNNGSNYGDHIDVSAPGNYIYGPNYKNNTNYGTYWSGTSQATPHVAGVVSLMLSIDDNLDLESVRSILAATSEDLVGDSDEDVEGFDPYHGHGRINAFEALSAVKSTSLEIVKEVNFRFSPNPIKQGEVIEVVFLDHHSRVLSIIDVSGKLVSIHKGDQSYFSINSTNLEPATYFLKVQENGKRLTTKKFLIK